MPLPAVVPPPAQRCWSARPTVRSVAPSGVKKRREWIALVVEEVDALVEVGVVLLPVGDGVVGGDARGGEDGVPELGEGELGRVVGEDERGPGGGGGGDDGPVDFVAGDELHGGLVGLGDGDVGAGDFGGILAGEQRGIGAGDAHAGGAGFVGGGEGVVVPGGRVVEAGVGRVLVAGEGGGVVGVEGGDELGAGFVGLLGDAADERERRRVGAVMTSS